MHPSALPQTQDLVLIGGGHSHAIFLRMWGMNPLPGVRVSIINPTATAAYSGMLPGHVAGVYPRAALQLDLVKLARHAGARLILSRVVGLDRAARHVLIEGRAPIAYDRASIDIGITAEMPSLPGFAEHAVPVKPLDAYADAWQAFVEAVQTGKKPARVVIIGGGVAGAELALASAERLGPGGRVTVLEAAPEALSALGRGARARMRAHLHAAGIELLTNAAAITLSAGRVHLADGRSIEGDFILGSAATQPQGWLEGTGLALDRGFVSITPTLQSVSDPDIFAAGDIAHMAFAPRPKAGVYAVRQAPVLHHNIIASLSGGALRSYRPQRDYLKLIFAGNGRAVADKWGLPLDGRWLWRWKNRIDTRFMAMVHDLPMMPQAALPKLLAEGVAQEVASGKPLCGGCGAKVGVAALGAALASLPAARRADVISGPGDDAAILAHGAARQVLSTDHIRAFTLDPWLMARITAVHAMGDIWAMGAKPQAALAQVTLPPLSARLQERSLIEILAAASAEFREAGAELVGGHSALGAELTLGFTVTGLCETPPIGQAGAKPGDVLILTKPIGTGVILAAEMLRAAPGAAVAAALASMCRSQAQAAALLAPHAHAMTDITGFGLAGHLIGLLEASRLAATIRLADVPVLAGAEALSALGHGSSLLPANIAAFAGRITVAQTPLSTLLYDPQTAGGLLAAVAPTVAQAVLQNLRDAGESAAVIGQLEAGEPHLTVLDA